MKKLETLEQLCRELEEHEEYVSYLEETNGSQQIIETEKKIIETLRTAIAKASH